ncbi:hypothetical protein C8J57DRAFT_1601158 [Mycena rebaudengoi]|nr:hypothetical protein C8J57DRAFT_1601158 [Mycena rebaudengoi]
MKHVQKKKKTRTRTWPARSGSPPLRCHGGHPAHTSSSTAGEWRAFSVAVTVVVVRSTTRQASVSCGGSEAECVELVEVEATSTLASTDNVDVDGDAEFAAGIGAGIEESHKGSVALGNCDGELAARQSSASSGTRKFDLLGGQIQRGKIGVHGERSVILATGVSACRIKIPCHNSPNMSPKVRSYNQLADRRLEVLQLKVPAFGSGGTFPTSAAILTRNQANELQVVRRSVPDAGAEAILLLCVLGDHA